MTDSLYENLNQLESDELVYKISHSMLTREAHKIALELLAQRGVNVAGLAELPNEEIGARTYGVASEEEQEINKNTFANFFLLLALPLFELALMGGGSHYASRSGLLMGIVIASVTFTLAFITMKLSYQQLFHKVDKLNTVAKTSSYGTSLLITGGFTLILLFSILNK
ncbi:hypothetical protein C5F52_03085 [Limnohabitans sp. TS-CS-82]|uniref:hypothetical protein n=1 Tax=Limnohabitans sp. TS-CS-82 TaxID=2094193 RepID=UPI000CF2B1D5|nr:hypothetical protein [Limnohabitans sp. TS-CS-82]PQA84992.1 hypothetical protein C5F52_03085 [Limnohabitans sp. TS-CS-82]